MMPANADRADVMIVGEGPGESEDVLGRPFIGRAGKLMRQAISDACDTAQADDARILLANLLACRPTDGNTSNRPPREDEVEACRPRVVRLVEIFRPVVVVCVGRSPEEYFPQAGSLSGWKGPLVNTYHPSYLIRRGGLNSPEYPAYVATLTDAILTALNGR